jgi:D-alanine-D-alanine ligase
MDPGDRFVPSDVPARELRILVLHNHDFENVDTQAEGLALSAAVQARADVANAARSVARALAARGHIAEVLGIDRDDIPALLARLLKDPPDLVFNLVESLIEDDRHAATIPALLSLFGVPYTGCAEFNINLTLRKHVMTPYLRSAGILTPPSVLLPAAPRGRGEDLAAVQAVGYPLFLKLAESSGSIGISHQSVVRSDQELLRQLNHLRQTYREPVLAERFIAGRELYVSLLGNAPPQLLPLQEIDFSKLPAGAHHIVTEDAKWQTSSPEYLSVTSGAAGPIPLVVRSRVEDMVRRTCALLDVRDYGRCDIRLSDDGTPYIIDVNGNCDLSEGAGYARAAALAGLAYDQLIEQIALTALQRTEHARQSSQRESGNRIHLSSSEAGRSRRSAHSGRVRRRLLTRGGQHGTRAN